jgi:hypothetical protein
MELNKKKCIYSTYSPLSDSDILAEIVLWDFPLKEGGGADKSLAL